MQNGADNIFPIFAFMEVNIYCDESCHLEKDESPVMGIGAIICPKQQAGELFIRIREIKKEHKLKRDYEIKWNKVSKARLQFYKDLISLFFDRSEIGFRAIIIPDKAILDHKGRNQTHDDFYYKMYFEMIKAILAPINIYHIYLDMKDTQGGKKVKKLHDVICKSQYDFEHEIIKKVEQVQGQQNELIQLCDLITGAIVYCNRGLTGNSSKIELVKMIQKKSGYSLKQTTLIRETKVNLLIWSPE